MWPTDRTGYVEGDLGCGTTNPPRSRAKSETKWISFFAAKLADTPYPQKDLL